jgi:hypothetical protein
MSLIQTSHPPQRTNNTPRGHGLKTSGIGSRTQVLVIIVSLKKTGICGKPSRESEKAWVRIYVGHVNGSSRDSGDTNNVNV